MFVLSFPMIFRWFPHFSIVFPWFPQSKITQIFPQGSPVSVQATGPFMGATGRQKFTAMKPARSSPYGMDGLLGVAGMIITSGSLNHH